jgi:hypothetical protein
MSTSPEVVSAAIRLETHKRISLYQLKPRGVADGFISVLRYVTSRATGRVDFERRLL